MLQGGNALFFENFCFKKLKLTTVFTKKIWNRGTIFFQKTVRILFWFFSLNFCWIAERGITKVCELDFFKKKIEQNMFLKL